LAWQRLCRNQLALLGLLIVLFWVGLAIGADALAPYHYNQFDFNNVEQDPSVAHFLGTDFIGRDMLTLLMYGARIPIAIAIVVPLMVILMGVPIGVIAGYAGGWLDVVLMRFTDVFFAFPSFLFMVLVIATFGRNLWTIFAALGISAWPTMARLVRAEMMRLKNADYILSARAIGARRRKIIFTHMLPNLVGPVAVAATLAIPGVIMAEAFLTFLGIGIEPTIPSWGMIINDARESIFWHPVLVLIPSLAISSLTLAFSFLGDGLRDALDPRMGD
jgi:oligopeptide transport system permease protein